MNLNNEVSKIYLNVPFFETTDAKKLGVKFDWSNNEWYVLSNSSNLHELQEKWGLNKKQDEIPTKIYLNVPYSCFGEAEELGVKFEKDYRKSYILNNHPNLDELQEKWGSNKEIDLDYEIKYLVDTHSGLFKDENNIIYHSKSYYGKKIGDLMEEVWCVEELDEDGRQNMEIYQQGYHSVFDMDEERIIYYNILKKTGQYKRFRDYEHDIWTLFRELCEIIIDKYTIKYYSCHPSEYPGDLESPRNYEYGNSDYDSEYYDSDDDIYYSNKKECDENADDETKLSFAIKYNDIKLLQSLIDNNKIQIKKNRPWYECNKNELSDAALYGSYECLNLLIKYGFKVNDKGESDENTPLHIATCFGRYKAVKLLLEANAKVDVVNFKGNTPLYNAALIGDYKSVKLLLDYGADINKINRYNDTALMIAEFFDEEKCVELLRNTATCNNIADKVLISISKKDMVFDTAFIIFKKIVKKTISNGYLNIEDNLYNIFQEKFSKFNKL